MKKSKKKKIKKNEYKVPKQVSKKKIILVFSLILVLLIILFIIFKNLVITTKVIEKPYTPENCSNESIRKVWELIFRGSSENLTIINAPQENQTELGGINYSESDLELDIDSEIFNLGNCPVYSVYQVNGTNLKIMMGMDFWFFMDMKMVYAINGNFEQEAIENITSSLRNSSQTDINIYSITLMPLEENSSVLSRNIFNNEGAKSQFESVFKIDSQNWTNEFSEIEDTNLTLYDFIEDEEMENITVFGESINPLGERMKSGMVFGNSSLDIYIYTEASIFGILKTLEKQFGNWTSPINTSLRNITININNSKLELLKDYEDFQKVEIKENSQTIIETEINFTEDFDWTKITLKKQDINSTKGYVIINGLNYTKNITIDRLDNESKSVCIKDEEINSIEEISPDCELIDEYILECPGNISNNIFNLTCKIYGNKFVVTGLKHSAILEILPPEEPCIQNWECGEWTEYPRECGYRNCTDTFECGNITGKPIEYMECPIICIPDWECTTFLPEKCPKEERRTRTCTDLNECNKDDGKPSLTQSCERKNNLIWIIIGISVLIIILLVTIILSKKKKDEANIPKKTNFMPQQKTPPNPQQNFKPTYTQKNPDYYYPKEY